MIADNDNSSLAPNIALQIPSQITRRAPLRLRIAAMEQAASPKDKKIVPEMMRVI